MVVLVVQFADLLLRRTRLGLTLPGGGLKQLQQIRHLAGPELDWGPARWETEIAEYTELWQTTFRPQV